MHGHPLVWIVSLFVLPLVAALVLASATPIPAPATVHPATATHAGSRDSEGSASRATIAPTTTPDTAISRWRGTARPGRPCR